MTNEIAKCACCREFHPADEAKHDEQLGGLVCKECSFNLRGATAWLKAYGISRPVAAGDINIGNFKRFSPELGFK